MHGADRVGPDVTASGRPALRPEELHAGGLRLVADRGDAGAQAIGIDVPHLDRALDRFSGMKLA